MSSPGLVHALVDCPADSVSVAVIGPGGPMAIHDSGHRHPWASVTKIATALTVLDAVQEGVVSLDDPAGPPGATLGDLLSHASGYIFDSERVICRPRRHRIYSNSGINAAAAHLAAATGRPFKDELHDRVLDLLDLRHTWLVGQPASGMWSRIGDLATLAQELLTPRLILPRVVELASTPVLPELGGVLPGFGRQLPNTWGYGCEIRDRKSPHWTAARNSPATFGHFGMSGSFCWVDRQARLACVFLCDRDFDDWAVRWWPVFSGRILDTYAS